MRLKKVDKTETHAMRLYINLSDLSKVNKAFIFLYPKVIYGKKISPYLNTNEE